MLSITDTVHSINRPKYFVCIDLKDMQSVHGSIDYIVYDGSGAICSYIDSQSLSRLIAIP